MATPNPSPSVDGIVDTTPMPNPSPSPDGGVVPPGDVVVQPPPQVVPAQDVAQTAGRAPQMADPAQDLVAAQNKQFDSTESGLRDLQKELKQTGIDQKAANAEFNAKMAAQQTPDALYAAHKAKDDAYMQAIQDKKIDPNQYVHNMSTPSKILSGIAMVISGAGAGRNGQNLALQQFNNAVQRDIESQQNDQSKAMNLWKMNREAGQDEMQAHLQTSNQLLTGIQAKMAQTAGTTQNIEARTRLLEMTQQLEQQKTQNRLKMAVLGQGSGGSRGMSQMDPASLVPILGEKHSPQAQQKALEEIGAAQDTVRNAPGILESFDKAAKNIHAVDFVPGMQNVDQKSLHTLLGPTFKDVEGTVRQAAMDNLFGNITPQFLDDKNSIATKRAALNGYLQSKSSAPTAKSMGIDLSKFKTTSTIPNFRPGDIVESEGKRFQVTDAQGSLKPL
jgi:hypothetical protein